MCAIVYSVCNYPMFHLIVCLYYSSVKWVFPDVYHLHSLSAISFLVSDIMCIWIHVNQVICLRHRRFYCLLSYV